MKYDYIITGGGCAGISLLVRMIHSGAFADKKILLIEKEEKVANDRTWCFWEKRDGLFDPIVYRSWGQVHFHSARFSGLLDLKPYRYKMIRGIDFYNAGYERIRQSQNIEVVHGTVESIRNLPDKVVVTMGGKPLEASYVFNSILLTKPDFSRYYSLQQHFKGWVVRTATPSFRSGEATLMDFRVDQRHGTTFVYVLPFDANTALVEYTLFTRDLLKPEEYDAALRQYMQDYLSIPSYQVEEVEFGVIPMTNYPFPQQDGRIIHIGTAGGYTKASSGYTFQFIQKRTAQIVASLSQSGIPLVKNQGDSKRFSFYDTTLLHILDKKKLQGSDVFTDLFQKGDAPTVFKFLDNETSFREDISIMMRLPKRIFAKAALAELIS